MTEANKVLSLHDRLGEVLDEDDRELELKSYDFTRDGSGDDSSLWSEEIKAWANMLTLESLFYSEDWVYIAVDLVASKIASQPLYVMKRTTVDGTESVDYADGHPLNALIEAPNPMQDYHAWMYATVTNLTLLGNAVEWYSKSNNWLVALRTSLVDIRFAQDNSIAAYSYSALRDDAAFIRDKTATIYDPKTIIHIRRPNPSSLLWGLSPFIPGRKSILFNRYSTDYLNSFYLKQATPGMIVEVDKQMNEQQALRQLRSFELAYTGRKNQRRTMLLPKGMKATPIAHSISDQKLVDLINMNRETVINLLKVPKHEVGLQSSGSLGSEEYKVALRNFWEATLIPTCRMIEGSLNKYFKAMLGPDYFFQFDLKDVEALKDDQMKKALMAKEMLAAGLSVNEVRTKVWEVEATVDPKDDIPFVSQPKAPAPMPGQGFSAPAAPSTTAPADTVTVQTDPLAPVESGKVIEAEAPSAAAKLREMLATRNAAWVETYVKTIDTVVNDKEGKRLNTLALDTLVSMAEAAVPVIKAGLRETKAADVPSKTKLRRELAAAFNNFEGEWLTEYAATLSSTVDLGYDQQLEFVFNKPDKEKIEALRARDSQKRREILVERGIESFDSISKSHTERIMAEISRGVDAGETIQQITRRVADTFADPEAMAARAATIARTETLTAVSIGQGAAFRNASEIIPGLRKGWLNADDSRVRDTHLDKSQGGVSGEVVGADEAFSNGLRWPRDVTSGDPGQVINCRCTMVTLLPGEDLQA